VFKKKVASKEDLMIWKKK